MQSPTIEVLPLQNISSVKDRDERLAQLEARRVGRTIQLPTKDTEVRDQFRLRGLPICYFGEDWHDRRERLRSVLAQEHLQGQSTNIPSATLETSSQQNEDTEVEEEYYTEGSIELKNIRMEIAKESLKCSFKRLEQERKETDWKEDEQKIIDRIRNSYMVSSHIGDERPLCAIEYAKDEQGKQIIITGGWGGLIKTWDVDDNLLETISTHSERISAIHFQKGVLLTASADCTGAIHTLKDNMYSLTQRLTGHVNRVTSIQPHPFHSHLIATSSFDGSFLLHSTSEQHLLYQETGHDKVHCLRMHPDGGLLATCGSEGGVRMWDLRSGRAVMTMKKAHAKDVTAMDFARDGVMLATGGADNVMKIWDLRKRACVKTIAAHRKVVSAIQFGKHDLVVSAGFDGNVKVWSGKRDWGLVKVLQGHRDKVLDVKWLGEQGALVSCCYDKTWVRWAQM